MKNKSVKKILIMAMAAALLTGCGGGAKESYSESSYTEEAKAYDGGYGSYSGDWGDEVAEEEYAMPEAPAEASGSNGGVSIDDPSQTEETVSPTERKLMRTVNLDIETLNYAEYKTQLEAKVSELGGYIESASESNSGLSNPNRRSNVYYAIRIPVEKLDEFLSCTSNGGTITSRNESVDDVTLRYIDLESHKKALEDEKERLTELMQKAESIEDVIAAESRISDIIYELENYSSQMRYLSNRVSYATVNINLWEVRTVSEYEEPTFLSRLKNRFVNSIYDAVEMVADIIVFVIGSIPVLIVLGIIAVIFVFVIKKIRKAWKNAKQKRAEKKALKTSEE